MRGVPVSGCAAAVLLALALPGCSAFAAPSMLPLRHTSWQPILAGRAPPALFTTLSAQAEPVPREQGLRAKDLGDMGRRDLLRLVGGSALLPVALPQNSLAASQERTKGTVLVVGATGPIGQCVCQELLGQGYTVRALTRNTDIAERGGREDAGWVGQVRWQVGDLTKADSLKGLLKGVDKVVWCAGSQAYRKGMELNRKIYSESVGTIARLAAEEAKGLSSFVLVSSNGVTRFQDPEFPGSDYLVDVLRWKAEGEKLLRESGVPYTILRFAAYYGRDGVEATPGTIWISQGDLPGRKPMSLANLSLIVAKSLSDTKYGYKTFETSEAREGANPGGNWEEAMDRLVDDAKAAL